jgi:hypothetical protein
MQNSTVRQNLDVIVALVAAACVLAFAIYWNLSNPRIVIRYDCSIAEISPDYPPAVKEGCRKLRADNILQKPK